MDTGIALEFGLKLVVWIFGNEKGGGASGIWTIREGDGEGLECWEGSVARKNLFGGELEENWLVVERFCRVRKEL